MPVEQSAAAFPAVREDKAHRENRAMQGRVQTAAVQTAAKGGQSDKIARTIGALAAAEAVKVGIVLTPVAAEAEAVMAVAIMAAEAVEEVAAAVAAVAAVAAAM